ncbi:protein shuttle craft-like [Scylla paramamosain]|uniref:protein shuttle craft-like n=1 Tax=Scylla paramamosain TaxID=85552 RepID=UPI003083888E
MAEGSGNRYPGQAPGYYTGGYPVLPSGQPPSLPMQMFPSPTTHTGMFMSQFARDMQYNQYPGHSTQYPSHNSTQYHGHSAQYSIHGNHFPDNSNIQTNRHYEPSPQYFGNSHYSGNVPFQDRTNMQSQAKYMTPTSPIASVSFDNSYSRPNANVISHPHTTEQHNESRGGHSQSRFSGRSGQNVNAGMNYSHFTADPEVSVAHSGSNVTKDAQYTGRRENHEVAVEASPGSVNNTAVKSATAPTSSLNKSASESGVFSGPSDNGGARSKGMVRGRGGRGKRGGRKGSYVSERPGQQNSNGYSWYDSQENRAEEHKRERDNALAETAAFMKNLSIKKDNSSPQHDITGDRRNRGRGKYDRGGGGGGGSGGGRYQRDYCSDDKQGKEWVNRQVRTEGEKNSYEMQNNYTKLNNNSQRKVQPTDNLQSADEWKPYPNSKDSTRTAEGNDNKQNTDFLSENERMTASTKSGGNARPARGRAQGKQERKLWDSRHAGNSPTNTNSGNKSHLSPDSRSKEENSTAPPGGMSGKEDEESQRDRLSDQLTKGTYECMVCCDRIKQQHAIWSCLACFNCFHLGCIRKWAKSSTGDGGWRCPACQGSTPKVPNAYMCFCGKMREPEWNRRDLPHSCGEMCGRRRKIEWCIHKCTLLCHPGPCPPCTAYIRRSCACGAQTQDVKCSQTEPFVCGGVCGQALQCKGHNCQKLCHEGPCGDCEEKICQTCHCGKNVQMVACTESTYGTTTYSCENNCGRLLDCENHRCEAKCHPSECQPCELAVQTITRCPCGKVPLEKLYERDGAIQRRSCSDPVPTCSQPCQRVLKCGVPGSFHECQALCHEGPCPPCPLETPVKCRCGAMDCNVPCSELTTKADEATCKKPCKKLRRCGRHKCNTRCCIDLDHLCTLVCGKLLSCGLHKCEEPCHRGNCPRCWQTSFEELTCHCGASVIYPPVPCGTKPPACDNPCNRPQECPHTATHLCHPDEPCPPCTMLVDKPCFGNHKMMRRTLCYLNAVSCGGICGFPLPCGLHKCQRVCHEQPCVPEGMLCTQKCSKPRETCGHPCATPCHSGLCPDTPCKEMVQISCECGLRKATLQCSENDREYRALATSMLASQMQNMNNGCTVDLSEIFTATARPDKLKRLPCNEDCLTEQRNRRLALALQIENPEAREKLGSSSTLYSEFMKEEARKDPNLAKMVHSALEDLVLRSRESKQKSCIHSFPSMNREKRHFIHEYCEHFGCQSEAYDEEPNKNVVATAYRGMCYLPPISVLTVVQREQGQRKVPAPVWSLKSSVSGNGQGMQKLEKLGSVKKEADSSTTKPPPIDYFDFED